MTCGTTAESNDGWPVCDRGCGVELGYVIDDDMRSPEKLACVLCVQRAMRQSKV